MRYEKPIVIDLGQRARAQGQRPQACIPGGSPGTNEVCSGGTSGEDPTGGSCLSGNGASGSGNYCVGGSGAKAECSSGSSAAYQLLGCTTGPTPT